MNSSVVFESEAGPTCFLYSATRKSFAICMSKLLAGPVIDKIFRAFVLIIIVVWIGVLASLSSSQSSPKGLEKFSKMSHLTRKEML